MTTGWSLRSALQDIANELLKRRTEMDAVKENVKADDVDDADGYGMLCIPETGTKLVALNTLRQK